jgi:hypothetical protein
MGDRSGIASQLGNLGNMATDEGDYPAACDLHGQSLAIRRELGERNGISYSLEALARLSWAAGSSARAARLWGASESLREAVGAPRSPSERAAYDRDRAAAREALGETAFDFAFSEGRAMTWEQAAEYGLSEEPEA